MATPVPGLLLLPIERLLNRGIRQSLSAADIGVALEGKSLDLRLDNVPVRLRITLAGGSARVTSPGADPATATLAGPPTAMLRLLGGDPESLIREGDVRVSGDSSTAQAFRDLFRMARPDLEEELSRLVGDPAAHQLGNLARGVAAWGARATESIGRSVGEFLTEERRVLPARAEAEEFYAAVDRLANDVDRAAARLQRLLSPPFGP